MNGSVGIPVQFARRQTHMPGLGSLWAHQWVRRAIAIRQIQTADAGLAISIERAIASLLKRSSDP